MWSIAKALRIPLDSNIIELTDIPYTISFVVRKRLQVDNFNELPKEKRPPEEMIWDGTSEELEDWIERVFKTNDSKGDFIIPISEIEG